MRPIDIAKTAILTSMIGQREPQDAAQLITAVNAYAPGSPTVAMEPAKNELLKSGHLEEVEIGVRQGFFNSTCSAFKLTAAGEELAYALQGKDINLMKATAAFALLTAVEERGFLLRDYVDLDGVGKATTLRVFDQLCADGHMRAGTQQGSIIGYDAGFKTPEGSKQLDKLRKAAGAPAAA